MANFQLGDTEKVSYTLTALDADSNPAVLADGDTISVTSSDPASASVVADATPISGSLASGFIVGGKKIKTGVSITFSATKADGSLDLTVVDLIDIVGGTATSLSVSLGSPIAQ